MESKDARIYVASVGNISKRLEYYGDADISNISLLKLIYKYACYSTTYNQLKRLNSMVSTLQVSDSNICLEIQASKGSDYVSPIGIADAGSEYSNTAPTISDNSFTLGASDGSDYTFSTADIYSGYSDAESSTPGNFVIKSLPSQGSLRYDGAEAYIETLYSDPTLLTYTRSETTGYVDSFTWSVYDNDSQLPLESNKATMTGTMEEEVVINQPATVGDRAQYSGNRSTTVFSVADFTLNPIAPYYDPEGNDLDAIRIDEISDANTGVYYYFGSPVTAGQIITAAELSSGAFYHIAPDSNAVSTDSFNASVRDDVNMTWVS